MKIGALLGIMGLALSLTACGASKGDRALSGGGIGAAAGAAGTAIAGGNPAVGAIVGGAAGAVTGAVTSDKDVNLGKPVWR